MKVKDVQLGEQYAVRFTMPATPGIPSIAPVVFATALDTAGNTVVLDYARADCGLHGEALERLRRQQAGSAKRRSGAYNELPTGRKLIRVPAADVVCHADDWETPGAPDGRLDGDVPMARARKSKQTRLALL